MVLKLKYLLLLNSMKTLFHFILVFHITFLFGCANYGTGWDGPGLKTGVITEEDMKENDWDRKDLVETIQSSLNELGYPTDNKAGIEDDSTKNAILRYKSDHDLEVNDTINASLEKHIDNSIWKRRKERSPDQEKLAQQYAENQEILNCKNILGENYTRLSIPKVRSGKSVVYVYRYTPTENAFNIYPISNILINDSIKGKISDNSYIRLELSPGEIKLNENTTDKLEIEKRSEPLNFKIIENEVHFVRLLAGKYDGSKKYTNIKGNDYWPYWLVGGVAGYLLHQAFKNTVLKPSDKTVKEKFYFADFIKTSNEIGKCHIQAINIL